MVRLWLWELERLNNREWGLPTGRRLWRAWRTKIGGVWWVFRFEPNPDLNLVTIARYRVVLRSGPRFER